MTLYTENIIVTAMVKYYRVTFIHATKFNIYAEKRHICRVDRFLRGQFCVYVLYSLVRMYIYTQEYQYDHHNIPAKLPPIFYRFMKVELRYLSSNLDIGNVCPACPKV